MWQNRTIVLQSKERFVLSTRARSNSDTDVSVDYGLGDNQRRLICRTAFMLLCALPTIAVTYLAMHQRTASQWAKLIQAELGVETTIGAIERPRPGVLILKDLKLLDEHRNPVFESLLVKITTGNTNRIEIRNPINVDSKGLSFLLNEATRRLVKASNSDRTVGDLKPWHVELSDFTLSDEAIEPGGRSLRTENLHVSLINGASGRELKIEALDTGSVTIARDSDDMGGGFRFLANTRTDVGIPCWAVKAWYPDLNQYLGTDAKFAGHASILNPGSATQQCELQGVFSDVRMGSRSLDELFADCQFHGHQWTGHASFMERGIRKEIPLQLISAWIEQSQRFNPEELFGPDSTYPGDNRSQANWK